MEKLVKLMSVSVLVSLLSVPVFAEEADDIEHEIEYELGRELEQLDVSIAEGDPVVEGTEDVASLEELKQAEKKAAQLTPQEKEAYKKKVAVGLEKQYQKKVAIKKKKALSRRPASHFKQGFLRLKKNCPMHLKANGNSPQVLQLKRGKKLWVEHHGLWMKGFRKRGTGFISKHCF